MTISTRLNTTHLHDHARQKLRYVLLQAGEIRSVNEKVEYVVNANHVLSFPLSADIVPVNLDFSAEDLSFQFSLDNWDQAVEKVLILDNPHKFPVSFTVESTNPTFQVRSRGVSSPVCAWTGSFFALVKHV